MYSTTLCTILQRLDLSQAVIYATAHAHKLRDSIHARTDSCSVYQRNHLQYSIAVEAAAVLTVMT